MLFPTYFDIGLFLSQLCQQLLRREQRVILTVPLVIWQITTHSMSACKLTKTLVALMLEVTLVLNSIRHTFVQAKPIAAKTAQDSVTVGSQRCSDLAEGLCCEPA